MNEERALYYVEWWVRTANGMCTVGPPIWVSGFGPEVREAIFANSTMKGAMHRERNEVPGGTFELPRDALMLYAYMLELQEHLS